MDKTEALKIVQEKSYELKNLPDKFKKDKEIVLVAVKQRGNALKYADKKLKKDKKIVLTAIKQNGEALQYADESLKKDREIVLIAVKKNPKILRYADLSLHKKIDPSFLFSETVVYGDELSYNEFAINEKDVNSSDKIKDFFSKPEDENENENEDEDEDLGYYYTKGLGTDPLSDTSSGGIVLGILSDENKNKLDSVSAKVDDPDIDFTKVMNKGPDEFSNCHEPPKKGEIFLTYYYFSGGAAYGLITYKKDKKVLLEVESFWKYAVALNMETPEFEFTAQGWGPSSGGGDVKICFDDGKVAECDADHDEIIETISQHLISKGAFNK